MKTITVAETKAHLSEILKQIGDDGEVIITRRGKPVAKITAITPPKEPLASLAEFRRTLPKHITAGTEVLSRLREEQR